MYIISNVPIFWKKIYLYVIRLEHFYFCGLINCQLYSRQRNNLVIFYNFKTKWTESSFFRWYSEKNLIFHRLLQLKNIAQIRPHLAFWTVSILATQIGRLVTTTFCDIPAPLSNLPKNWLLIMSVLSIPYVISYWKDYLLLLQNIV